MAGSALPADLAGEELCADEALNVLLLPLDRTFLATDNLLILTGGLAAEEDCGRSRETPGDPGATLKRSLCGGVTATEK